MITSSNISNQGTSESHQRPADWRAREKARDPQHSCIVQAPAGSGKTELLTQRMLGLLSRVKNPEEVIAITFTRKAAAEMSHRLVSRLQAAVHNDDAGKLEPHEQVSRALALAVLENDANRGWELLQQPSRLRILTIDSLCSELARQLPVLSGLGGGQQIAVDARALYRVAATRSMAAIEDEGDELQADVIAVLDRYNNQYDRLVDLLTSMLENRDQWLEHLMALRNADGFDRQGLEAALAYLVELQLERARQIMPKELLTELPQFYDFAIGNKAGNAVQLTALLQAHGGPDGEHLDLPVSADALPHWRTLADSLLTGSGSVRKQVTTKEGFPALGSARDEDERILFRQMKDNFVNLLDRMRENEPLRHVLDIIRLLPDPDYEDEAWESLESLMRILLRAASEWQLVMAQTGEVDFSEISDRAIKSLGAEDAPSELALRLDYRIQHLLVDEFQDTSASQIRLLRQLTSGWSDGDGRTLFLVGDPMQSIYRFRKAEVSLFLEAVDGTLFDHIRLRPLKLTVNFRSTRPIVNWINECFPSVMPPENDAIPGAVKYTDACVKPAVSDLGGISIQILPQNDYEQEAQRVIDTIRKCHEDETIAILVRSRAHASDILAALDNLKLANPRYRYQAIKFTRLAETTLIRDLVSLTLALVQPADRLAWLATLRAPYIGLELADLDVLVGGNTTSILIDALTANADCQNGSPAISTTGQQRMRRISPLLLGAVDQRGRQSTRSLVESTWTNLGGPACVENASELSDAATYFDLLDSLAEEDLPIDRDTLDLRMQDLRAEPDTGDGINLQVLTIYEAKGLQFDTVILPGLNRATRTGGNKLLHWFELAGEKTIVMSPMRNTDEKERDKKSGNLIDYIANVEKQRRSLEDGRLLYVAATRAIKNLHLFATIKPNAKGEIKANGNTLLGGLWPAIAEQQVPLIEQAAEKAAEVSSEETGEQFIESSTEIQDIPLPKDYRRLTHDWSLPSPPTSVESTTIEPSEIVDHIEFSWAGEGARLTGVLVHRLLQEIAEHGLDHWESSGGTAARVDWCIRQLASEGIQKDKSEAIIKRASVALDNCLGSNQGRWLLEDHEDAHCEHTITAALDGQPRNLILDRTFIDKGIRWIIDYKTSSHSGGDLEGFLENEATRYREQLRRYQTAMAMTETRPIKTALYFPLLDRLCEV